METTREVVIGPGFSIGGGAPLALIAGPCAIESQQHALEMADALKEMTDAAGVPFIYKSSYDKANRTSVESYRGPGLSGGLAVLERVRQDVGVPVLSDVHEVEQVMAGAEVLDVLQIPAFLCRQTDLLLAAGRTGKPVNVKKGQFLAPWDMQHVAQKIDSTENSRILLTERGASFGYNNLVADMRSLAIMRSFGYPVVFDATHSVQLPGGAGGASSGQREFVPALTRAAVGVGIDALFVEVHADPDRAPSDGPNMLKLADLPALLSQVVAIDAIVRQAA
ncbi:MAG: 2-dehydro-3-deoxyphosphooctonate aldolase [Candidatus Entotheonella factor]|uniref:2-dehydro-3-deoxyphosphooctonate aldolase n=1 Tax=Entotheonella factor TaxID=1429438 RepID=W4LBX8_ENTF1|nr:3-deoxy-8-phosphooctulonate synthase [Candidatus Entotheonella palauensis]ETW95613.1 MAG: 2-dehydro-3-deoxyphosphooctonate aldolase [Candidatus Entotheonella factor]